MTGDAPEGPTGRNDPARLLATTPLRAVLRLAIPTSAVMVLGAASGVFHTWFVSRLGGTALAAVSLVFPIHLIVLTIMGGGIGAGVSSAVARAIGAGRDEEAAEVAGQAIWATVGLAALLTTALVVGARPMLRWMGGVGAVLDEATTFARVLFGGAFVAFSVATFDSILRGEGNVRVPTTWASVSLFLQIVLTPVFMFGLGLGLAGAAVATIAGQSCGLVPRAVFVLSGRSRVRPRLWPIRPRREPLEAILRVGVPASLGTVVNYSGLLLLTAIVARFGTSETAAFGLGTRLDFLVITLAYGPGSAVLTLVGMATGAGDVARVRAFVSRGLVLAMLALGGVGVTFAVAPELWLRLFTHDRAILDTGSAYLSIVAPSYPFLAASMVLSFAFQGVGRAVLPMVVVAVRTIAVVGVAAGVVASGGPVELVFSSVLVGNVAGAVLLAVTFGRTGYDPGKGMRRK